MRLSCSGSGWITGISIPICTRRRQPRRREQLIVDAHRCSEAVESDFDQPTGLLELYYEKNSEEYDQLRTEAIAEKFQRTFRLRRLQIETIGHRAFRWTPAPTPPARRSHHLAALDD
ncbi:hypothetical protein C8039_12270 [Halogeometricum sp. wsp3]|nr:hypothetical protein C8039_12270 [Halogeometricum sp. wsp3]